MLNSLVGGYCLQILITWHQLSVVAALFSRLVVSLGILSDWVGDRPKGQYFGDCGWVIV